MKLARTSGTLGLAALAAIASPFAAADDAGWYGGVNVGQSRAKIDDARITSNLLGGGLTTTSISDDKHDTGGKLFVGYRFNRHFALEGGYFELGQFGFRATTAPAGSLTGNIKLNGVNLDAVGIVPITKQFSVFGRAGLIYAAAKDSFTGTGSVTVINPNPSKTEMNYKFGVGGQYDFTESLGIRVEAERYRINDAIGTRGDIDLISVGLVYRFGGTAPAPASRAAAFEPVAAAQAPQAAPPAPRPVIEAAPVTLVVVPIARTQEYCSILDIQFEVNQNTVQRESEEKIGKVVSFMQKYPDTTAVIEGHTDEVGTAADNMLLSQRRAQNLVSYLADNGIARSRLQAVGFGDTRPIADNRTEVGKRLNRRIDAVIACATDIEGLTQIPARITMAMEMEFGTNQADIRPQYREELRKVANFLKSNPGVTATVEGHTSNQQGSAEQAMRLSQTRAQNVVTYLSNNFDVDRSRLSARGYGDTRRFAYNTSAEGQKENRRVNIILEFPN